jgi:ornithine carbamoyltransferase
VPKHFLTLGDFTPAEIESLVEEALRLKKSPNGEKPLEGKSVAILFAKSSTRTRLAFEVGIYQLGGFPIFLDHSTLQVGRGETLADTARVMSRYVDGLVVRTYEQSVLTELAEAASIPVINALTNSYHPTQAVADFATLLEKKGRLKGLKLAYVGDGNNVAHSLLLGGAMLGVDVHLAAPEGYAPDGAVVEKAKSFSAESGGSITITESPEDAVRSADAVYTDVWVSMGQEKEAENRKEAFDGFIIDEEKLKLAKPDCLVMHCLPAHRGEEISAGALDGPQSVVWDQAEYKLHAQKAVLKMVMGE